MRRLLIMLVLVMLLVAALMVGAQDMEDEDELPPLREIYIALSFGDEVFEPDLWLASATEGEARTTSVWNAAQLSALSYLDLLHFDDGYSIEGIDAFFNDTWFEAAFANYEMWERMAVCDYRDDEYDLTLHEFSMSTGGESYTMRYWIDLFNETRVAAIFIVFPASSSATLDDYSARLYPELPACE